MAEPSIDARERALCAAMSASEAVPDLLRYAREGEGPHGPFEVEVPEKLADALKLALEVGGEASAEDARGRLYAALTAFLEGWA